MLEVRRGDGGNLAPEHVFERDKRVSENGNLENERKVERWMFS